MLSFNTSLLTAFPSFSVFFLSFQRTARAARAAVVPKAFNTAVVVMTGLCLAAGRFGLAPTANGTTSAGLKISKKDSGLTSGDPAGFTLVDVMALGSMGHVLGVGIDLGLKAIN